MVDTDTIWLTQEACDKLREELETLKSVGRSAVAKKIAAARDEGDLSENGGYHAAREEQGQMEGRIKQLEHMLRNAQVGETPADPELVSVGTEVTIAYDGDADDTDRFLLGSREMMAVDSSVDTQVYSPQSPLGAALIGRRKGEIVKYEAPNGRLITVAITDVRPFQS